MKPPHECASLAEVRAEIDRIDQQLVALIAKRAGYVRAAAPFKASEQGVRAPERQRAMLEQRRQWALEQQLDPDVIERLFRTLVDHFIAQELAAWRQQASQ
jgi:isochorismate pyruvate lyase